MLTTELNTKSQFESARDAWTSGRSWLRAFRRTRPFWGGLWMMLGGFMILRVSHVSFETAFAGGIVGFGGWLTGGGLLVCGLLVWAGPEHRYVAGILGLLLAVSSLIVSNLGGFFIGMLLGIVGSSMAISWGPKALVEEVRHDED